jgi:ribose-phosphate pyrophosphokinase
MDNLEIFSGTAHPALVERICEYLGITPAETRIGRFPDGELDVRLEKDIRGKDVFIVQPTSPPVNENLMELLILLDTARRASAARVTAVIPYYGYARKDRKDEGRVPVTAKLVANMLVAAGANRVLAVDLHASQIQGFFDIPTDHLFAAPVLAGYFNDLDLGEVVVISADVGGVKMARAYSKRLGGTFAIVDKVRLGPEQTEVDRLYGEVEGKTAVIIDDMIATGGSVVEATAVLLEHGAKDVYIGATHGVFCGKFAERLRPCKALEVVVTDTIPLPDLPDDVKSRIKIVSVGSFLGEAIKRIHNNESVSSLFR